MRKGKPKKRYILPDPKFQDTMVTKFVNNLMIQGKKSIAYSIFYNALDLVEEKTSENGLEIWKKALSNVSPSVEVKSRRVGGATFQVPMEVRPSRKISLGMKCSRAFVELERDLAHRQVERSPLYKSLRIPWPRVQR